MFYFKSTVDKKLKSLEKRICELEIENKRLKKSLENQGLEYDDYWLHSYRYVNIKNLNQDFQKLLKHLNLHFTNIQPCRKLVELKEEKDED